MKERTGFCHRDVFLFVCFCLGVSEVLGFFLVISCVCVCVCVCVCERERERERERGGEGAEKKAL